MIKINLLRQKKPFRIPVILGIDLSQLNIKMVVIAFVLYKGSAAFLTTKWENEIQATKSEVEKLENQLKNIKRENKGNESVKAMLDAFGKQVEAINSKSAQVESVIKMKKNPLELLERLARNTPEDLWFNTLKISSDDRITLLGNSISYKSIGVFLNSSNESKFFGKSLGLGNSETKEETFDDQKVRVEKFIIEGRIIDYGRF